MEDTSLNDGIASEILSRLPAKTVLSCKCVSKSWNSLISHPSLLRAQFERSRDLSGIFFQLYNGGHGDNDLTITFVTLDEKNPQRLPNFLDFLPGKVVIMGSCNGLLCCRSCIYPHHFGETSADKELLIYICNPYSKERIAMRPNPSEVNGDAGFAFYPFGSSINPDPCFKLVSIHGPKDNSNEYSFLVYTSETGKWTPSTDVYRCNSKIRKNMMIFVGSRLHWLSSGHHIITFDIERELSAVVELPGPVMKDSTNWWICLGGSKGCLHYLSNHASEVRVWMLKDYGNSEWILKYNLKLPDFYRKHKILFGNHLSKEFIESVKPKPLQDETTTNYPFLPLAYSEDVVVFMMRGGRFCSNDFRTTELKEHGSLLTLERFIVAETRFGLPYTVCLAAEGVLKEGRHLGAKKNGKGISQKR